LPRRAQRTQSFVVFATKAVRHEEKLDGITELRGFVATEKTEDRWQKTENGEQKAEDGEQKAEDGGQQGGA